MKTIRYIVLVIASILIYQFSLQAQSSLKLEVMNFLKEYEKFSSFSKDGMIYEKTYETEFKNLFKGRNISDNDKEFQIFNDIDSVNKDPYLKKGVYVNSIENNYPKGINITIIVKEIGKPKDLRNGEYEVKVKVIKKLFGLNNEEKIYQKEIKLTFLISYNISGNNTISDLKIVNITADDFPRKPSGFYIGLNIQPSFTSIITNEFLNSNNTYGSWDENGSFTFNGGLEFNYYSDKYNFLIVGARINFTSYKSEFRLNMYSQHPLKGLTDADGDSYYLQANGKSFSEITELNFIEIPIFVKFRFGFRKISYLNHIYFSLGPVFSYGISNTVTTNGNYTYEGYYPEYNVLLYDIPQYDYYTDIESKSTPKSNIKSINIAGLVEMGINFPIIGEKLNMNLALIYQQGFANLSEGNESYLLTHGYNNNSSLIDSRSKSSTRLFGLNIGILYKIY